MGLLEGPITQSSALSKRSCLYIGVCVFSLFIDRQFDLTCRFAFRKLEAVAAQYSNILTLQVTDGYLDINEMLSMRCFNLMFSF